MITAISTNGKAQIMIPKDLQGEAPFTLVLQNGLSNQTLTFEDLLDTGNGYVYKFVIDTTQMLNSKQWNLLLKDSIEQTLYTDILDIDLNDPNTNGYNSGEDDYYYEQYAKRSAPTPGVENAVLYVPQTLTEEQQEQARINIGAASSEGGNQKQADWAQTDPNEVDYIKHKPAIPTKTSDLTNDSNFATETWVINYVDEHTSGSGIGTDPEAVHFTEQTLTSEQQAQARANIGAGTSNFSGNYNDLSNKPTIPAAQIQSDWNQTDTAAKDFIKNKPSIPAAQIQSDWNQSDNNAVDFIKNKPSIPAGSFETWTFTLSDQSTVTKSVFIGS